MPTVSLGYPAYNEEKNIKNLLDHLLSQKLAPEVTLKEIIIIASGCTDNTVNIVNEYIKKNPIVNLVIEKERQGHASAVNEIIKHASGDFLVIGCADTQPEHDVISRLVKPIIRDTSIGAVVGKAVPINTPDTLWGYIAHKSFYWNYLPQFLMIDFEGHTAMRREVIDFMPHDAIYTERLADAMMQEKGYRIVHDPEAITYIKEPDNFKDFIAQKRRNIFMHMQQKKENIPAPHIDFRKVIPIVFKSLELDPKKLFWLGTMLAMWGYGYILGWLDIKMGRSQKKWRMVTSSKNLIEQEEISK